MTSRSLLARFICLCLPAIICAPFSTGASAATYYVGPSGSNSLSSNLSSPGSLSYAVANAPSGSIIILENGTYDGAPNGFSIAPSHIIFRAQHWRGAAITNSAGSNLWGPVSKSAIDDTCEGIVFGPCLRPVNGGWSGGGGDGWVFRDCEFTKNDGVDFGSHSLVEHCLFTDQWWNSFDVNGVTGFTMRNCIARRGNRGNGDDNSIGNKEDFASNLTFDGLIAYDNEGPALWFDTDNTNWTVKNCTFFANHGGNNWCNLGVNGGASATQFFNYSSVPWGSAQDQAGVPLGAFLMCVTGTPENIGAKTKLIHVDVTSDNQKPSKYKFTFTVSPALPATPGAGDGFAVLQSPSPGYGLMSEANPNGSFIDNVTYNNTDAGFFDADSGNGHGVSRPGLVVTGNQFDYDGIAFRSATDGGPYRKLGQATIEHNRFKIGGTTMQNAFHWHDINPILGFPKAYYHIEFDHNIYDPGAGRKTVWADWYVGTGKQATKYYNAYSLSDLQNGPTFDQDHHSSVGSVTFRGKLVRSYVWPAAGDTNWSHVYFPNNKYSPSSSIHQVNDDETPYIQDAVAHAKAGKTVTLTVFGHTRVLGNGPYTCEVYDYSGRWILLDLESKADMLSLDAKVPGYAVLIPSRITVTLTSTDPYGLRATYRAGSHARKE